METMRDVYIDKMTDRLAFNWGLSKYRANRQAEFYIDTLEVFMARNGMDLYDDKVLVHPDVIKRNWNLDKDAEDWETLKQLVRFGYPETALDKSDGFIQVKLDFTKNVIRKIN